MEQLEPMRFGRFDEDWLAEHLQLRSRRVFVGIEIGYLWREDAPGEGNFGGIENAGADDEVTQIRAAITNESIKFRPTENGVFQQFNFELF